MNSLILKYTQFIFKLSMLIIQKFLLILSICIVSTYDAFSASWDLNIDKESQVKNTWIIKEDQVTWEEINDIEKKSPIEEQETLNEQPETLNEMQSNIKTLEREKVRLEFKWNTFRIGNENLGDLLRLDITPAEKISLETLITNYSALRNKTQQDLDNAIERWQDSNTFQNKLLELKRDLYKELIPYIEPTKISAFRSYIESDISFNEKSKKVAVEIEEKQTKRDERVEEIQDKIEDNAETLREQIKKKLTLSLQNKLDAFIAQEKFQALEDSSKIFLFERLITKLNSKKRSLQETLNPTSIIEERILLYEVVEGILYNYISLWQQ